MATGLGYKEFTTGDVLTAADANGYLASQVVMVFASAAARTSAIASPQEGMISYLKDTNSTEYYSGSAWAAIGGAAAFAGASVYTSSAVSIPNGTLTTVTWNAEDFDTNSYHSTSVNTGRLTVPSAGKYLINVMIGWDTTANTTTKTISLRKNGSDILKSNGLGTGSDYQSQNLQYIASASASDYFEVLAYQVTGGAINILQNANSTYQISYLGA